MHPYTEQLMELLNFPEWVKKLLQPTVDDSCNQYESPAAAQAEIDTLPDGSLPQPLSGVELSPGGEQAPLPDLYTTMGQPEVLARQLNGLYAILKGKNRKSRLRSYRMVSLVSFLLSALFLTMGGMQKYFFRFLSQAQENVPSADLAPLSNAVVNFSCGFVPNLLLLLGSAFAVFFLFSLLFGFILRKKLGQA